MAQGSEYEIAIGAYRFDPLDQPPPLPDALRLDEQIGAGQAADRPRSFLVQFQRPLTRQDRERVQREFGLKLEKYVPKLAYLERIGPDTAVALTDDELVRACVPYQPAFKVSPRIGTVPFRTKERRAHEATILETVLFDDADASEVVAQLTKAGAEAVVVFDDRPVEGPLRVRFQIRDPAAVEQIARIDDVQWLEEVAEMIEDDAGAAGTIQSGSAGKQSIWDKGLHGEGQIIGILDSSPVDINHCFFEDTASNDPGGAHRKVQALRNGSDTDPTFHATFVSGCAAGDDLNNPGAATGRGSAWAARIVSGNRNDFGLLGPLFELNAAAQAGATIHTNSWHDNTDGAGNPALYNLTAFFVDLFTWNHEDNLVLGSAGNTNEEQGPPGTAKNAVCVAAAQADPNEMTLGDGNPGPTADGRRKPDLVAVGCGIRSSTAGTNCSTQMGSCATSWATPHAAGAAALVRQYFTEGWYPQGRPVPRSRIQPTGALLKAMLLNSALDMIGVGGYPNLTEGWGLIRLEDVLSFPESRHMLSFWDRRHADGLSTGDTQTHNVDVVAGAMPLKVTLVWTEPPGTLGADDPVVNDLDLRVTSPDGHEIYCGNNFDGGASSVGGAPDDRNNVEVVLVRTPKPGRWTVSVRASRVSRGNPDQGYALVATTARADWLVPTLHVALG